MHGMQIALYILILFAHLSHSSLVLNRLCLIVPALVISLLLSVPFHPTLSHLVPCTLVTTLNSSLLSPSFLTRPHSFLVLNSCPRFSVVQKGATYGSSVGCRVQVGQLGRMQCAGWVAHQVDA